MIVMKPMASVGWMKLGLRAQICSQCHPGATAAGATAGDALPVFAAYACESRCALFVQLPRLALLLARYRAKPPAGYEESVLKLLSDSSMEISNDTRPASVTEITPGPFLDYSIDALAILERIAALLIPPAVENPGHDCTQRAMALGQMSVHAASFRSGNA
jgi:hypothetical protein